MPQHILIMLYVYSSMAPDPAFDMFGALCTPIIWIVFLIGLMRLITVRYFFKFLYDMILPEKLKNIKFLITLDVNIYSLINSNPC
jgi:hypothetical protein